MYRKLRLAAACLSAVLGAKLIGQLWLVALDAKSLGAAAYGLVFLLLALGLVGRQSLSLVLTVLACLPVFIIDLTWSAGQLTILGQILLLVTSLLLLITDARSVRSR